MTTKTANTDNNNTQEIKMTAKTAETNAPASDPKPRVRRSTKKAAATETVAPKPTEQQLQRMFVTAMAGAGRAEKALRNAVEGITNDPRTVERANHLQEKAIAARKVANERAAEAGKDLPFTGDAMTFKAYELPGTKTFEVTLVNMSDGTVQGHKAGCADIKRKSRSKVRPVNDPWTLDVENKHVAWLDYNCDFLAEGEESGTYQIDWLPCADSVPQGPDDTYEQYAAETNGEAETTEPAKAETKEPFASKAPRAAAGNKKATTARASGSAAATPKSEPKAKPAAVTPAQRSLAKAEALQKVAEEYGWDSTLENGDNGSVMIECRDAKGGERIVTWFIDGKMDDTRMPAYYRANATTPVLLRNVSAVRQQMDPDLSKRPVKMEVTRTRTARADSDRPRKSFTWDNELSDDELLAVLQQELAGKRLCWMANITGEANGGEPQEVLVGKVAKVYVNPKTNDRLIEFFSLEYSEKDKGMKSAGQRTVALAKITRVI